MMFKNQAFASVAILVGTIVGAGFLGIPFVVAKSGFPIGVLHIIILGLIMIIASLMLGEITLRTKGNHQLTGYAEIYLGKTGKTIMLIALLFGILSSLLAYTIGIAESISHLIIQNSSLIFPAGLSVWILMSLLTYFGMRAFKHGEIIGIFLMGAFLVAIVAWFAPKITIENLTYINPQYFFLPFGIVLYALFSLTALPELERILEHQKEKLKKAIIIGGIVPIIGYILFTMIVVGVKGNLSPEIATISLGPIFIILGVITMFTSYLAMTFVLKSILHFDYKIPKKMAWVIISMLIINLFLLAIRLNLTFTKILGAAGIIAGTTIGILVLIIAEKAKKSGDREPEYKIPTNRLLIFVITIILLTGAVMSLINL